MLSHSLITPSSNYNCPFIIITTLPIHPYMPQSPKAPPSQQYSFSHPHQFSTQTYNSHPHSQHQSTTSDLYQKYASITQQLNDVHQQQIIKLFIEELEEYQKVRNHVGKIQRILCMKQEENGQLKALIDKKRSVIAQLCIAQSDHLNKIQQLESKTRVKQFNSEGHYKIKYKELEQHMNQYLASTQEIQEQLLRTIKIMKIENLHLSQENKKFLHQVIIKDKQIAVANTKVQRFKEMVQNARKKEECLERERKELKDEMEEMREENERLRQGMKNTEVFKIELQQQNKELSSQLDFIRQKISQNQTIRKDIYDKIQQHSQKSLRLTHQLQSLKLQKHQLQQRCQDLLSIIQQTQKQRQSIHSDHQVMQQHIESLQQLLQNAHSQLSINSQYTLTIQEELERIKESYKELVEEYQEMQQMLGEEHQAKENIKKELIELAKQVRFMESSYQKQIIQNQQIKNELTKFWQQRTPLMEISRQNSNKNNSPTFEQSHKWFSKIQPQKIQPQSHPLPRN